MVSTWVTQLSEFLDLMKIDVQKNVENILEMSVECVGMEGVTMVTMHMFLEVLDVFWIF